MNVEPVHGGERASCASKAPEILPLPRWHAFHHLGCARLTGTLTHSLFPPFKPTWNTQHWMPWRLMRFGWLAFYLLCSSRTTVDLLRCTWVRLQWDVARCILSETVRLVHLSAGQLRHQLSSSLPYRDLGWEPADRLSQNLWLPSKGVTMSIPFPAGCLPDPVFSWQSGTLILHGFNVHGYF